MQLRLETAALIAKGGIQKLEQQMNTGRESTSDETGEKDSRARRPGALAYFSGLTGVSLALTVALWPVSSLLLRNTADLPLFPNSNVFWAHFVLAVISFICGVMAVILGRIAVSRDQDPGKLWLKRGRTGIILGIISMTLLLIFVVISTVATSTIPVRETAPREDIQRMNSFVV